CGRLDAHAFAEPSLLHGWAGIALVHGYRAFAGEAGAEARAHDALATALEQIDSAETIRRMLGTGVVGVGWVMQHLRALIGAGDATLEQIDAMVLELVARDRWTLEYELWEGLVGLGVYALERGRVDVVAHVVRHLDRLA